MRKIWQITKKRFSDQQNSYRVFIFLSTFFWTVLPFLAVTAICILFGITTLQTVSIALSISGITGIMIGFFGSLLYLLQNS